MREESDMAVAVGGRAPRFGAPPVAEVALAIHIEPTPSFASAHCAAFWGKFLRDTYPTPQNQPASPFVQEDFEGDGIGPSQVFFGFGSPDVRYWFLNPDQTRLIQMQPDRLILNWRKLQTDVYPHYANLKSELERVVHLWSEFLDNGLPAVVQAEVTYVNHIPVDEAIFSDVARVGDLLTSLDPKWPGTLGRPEIFAFEQRFALKDPSGHPARLYVTAAPGVGALGERILSLTLTVRGRPADTNTEGAFRWLDFAHEHIIRSFASITTPSLRAHWKEED